MAQRPVTVAEGAPRVCVSRPASGGARFETTVGSQPPIDRILVADGTARPVTDLDCVGTEVARWSKSGLRLFSSAETRCKGDLDSRRVSGVSLIAPNGDWLDVQSVTIGSRQTVRVTRYARDGALSPSGRPNVAASALTIDEIVDALDGLSPLAVEAALVESNAGFNLTAQRLRGLSSAGVPERIIDVMVALSYPEKFVVQRSETPPLSSGYSGPLPLEYAYPYYGGIYYYGTPLYYAPFGYYGSFGWDGYSFIGLPSVIVDAPVGGEVQSNGPGRAINRQGYTRIEPRESVPASAASERNAATSSSSPTPSSSGSSGSAGNASAGGGYSGGGNSDSGRTAVPR
jgi:hypothetical protein